MKRLHFLIVFSTLSLRLDTVKTSYMDVPRIHFKGKFRADVDTHNCFKSGLSLDQGKKWNFNETSEWEFIDTYVSSVVDQSGGENPSSHFMGARVFSDNDELPAEADVGLQFGIKLNGETIFKGKWLTSVIDCNVWYKMICTLPGEEQSYSVIITSRITNIEWSDTASDLWIATLCDDCTGDLSVSIELYYYPQEVLFTLGNVVGTIGAAKKGESLNVGGERKLESTETHLTFPKDHICSRDGVDPPKQLTSVAPFTFDKSRKTLILDISNAFPVDYHNKPIDLGELWLGIISDETVTIFGDPIPYKNPSLMDHGGIIEQVADPISVPLENSLLVIIKKVFSNSSGRSDIYPISKVSLKQENLRGQLVMKELECKPRSVITSPSTCRHLQTLTGNSSTAVWPSFSDFDPPRCKLADIPYHMDPEQHDPYFKSIKEFTFNAENTPRPLFGYGNNIFKGPLPKCSAKSLKDQLQLAVQIEFATIPLYLTSLYSIINGTNVEASELIKNIVIQEMLHFSQAANILIAIGGNVAIDDAKAVPKYPVYKLPGGVLPKLQLHLKKFTLKHVYKNFMAVESPMLSCTFFPEIERHMNTIAEFYMEIKSCLYTLRDTIFVSGSEKRQVKWTWGENDGTLYTVTDWKSAHKAINEIIEQGEGARFGPLDPSTDQYAHFYRFEEIVCQHELEKLPTGYAYTGDPIPYNAAGVWPMRDDPSKENTKPGSPCYTVSKAFNSVYRHLLRVLQKAFNGRPKQIEKSVELMHTLATEAKKTMMTPLNSHSYCGPVWDYEF